MLFDINGKPIAFGTDAESYLPAMIRWRNHGYPMQTYDGNYDSMLCVAHISDIHLDEVRYERFLRWVSKHKKYVKCAIISGDLIDTPLESQYNCMTPIENKFQDITLIKCVGNHEKFVKPTILSNADIYTLWNFNTNTGKTWYYEDYHNYNTRLVVLNAFDCDNAPTNNVSLMTNTYSQEQIDWFISTLQDAKTKDYSVVVVRHSSESGKPIKVKDSFYDAYDCPTDWYVSVCNGTPIEDIVDAFQHGTSLSKTYTYTTGAPSITVDVEFQNAGKFVCYLGGHYHIDMIGTSSIYPDQLYCIVAIGRMGYMASGGNFAEKWTMVPRVEGTESEDCFNVYAFDTTNRQIKVLRIGSHVTCEMTERLIDIYTY